MNEAVAMQGVLLLVAAVGLLATTLTWRCWDHRPKEAELLDAALSIVEATLLESPHEWEGDFPRLNNHPREISLYIGGGASNLGFRDDGLTALPGDGQLPIYWKMRLHKAAMRVRALQIAGKFKEE